MHRSTHRNFIGLFLGAMFLTGTAGCGDIGNQVPAVPTAAQPCPPWVEFPADSHSNADSAYLGCVNAVNLRSMVEKPDDLVQGRTLGPASGERESVAVDAYLRGSEKASKSVGTASPTIVLPAAVGGGTE